MDKTGRERDCCSRAGMGKFSAHVGFRKLARAPSRIQRFHPPCFESAGCVIEPLDVIVGEQTILLLLPCFAKPEITQYLVGTTVRIRRRKSLQEVALGGDEVGGRSRYIKETKFRQFPKKRSVSIKVGRKRLDTDEARVHERKGDHRGGRRGGRVNEQRVLIDEIAEGWFHTPRALV